MEELLVYSRLKRGLAFHYRLEQATLVGTAVSVDAVYAMRGFGFPVLYEQVEPGVLLAVEPTQGAQFVPQSRMRARRSPA
jgi:hypothetical protein